MPQLIRLLLIAIFSVVFASVPCRAIASEAPADRKPGVAVLRLEAKGGLSSDVVEALDDFLAFALFETKKYDLVNRDRIEEVMKEFRLQKSGVCDTTKCYAELGGAMGAEKLVYGSVASLGDRYITTLKLIDIALIKEEFVGSQTTRGAVGDLPSAVSTLVAQMTGTPAPGDSLTVSEKETGKVPTGKEGSPNQEPDLRGRWTFRLTGVVERGVNWNVDEEGWMSLGQDGRKLIGEFESQLHQWRSSENEGWHSGKGAVDGNVEGVRPCPCRVRLAMDGLAMTFGGWCTFEGGALTGTLDSSEKHMSGTWVCRTRRGYFASKGDWSAER